MTSTENYQIVLAEKDKPEFFRILEELDTKDREIFLAICYFYPLLTPLSFILQEDIPHYRISAKKQQLLQEKVMKINRTLENLKSDFVIFAGKNNYQLTKKSGETNQYYQIEPTFYDPTLEELHPDFPHLLEKLKGRDGLYETCRILMLAYPALATREELLNPSRSYVVSSNNMLETHISRIKVIIRQNKFPLSIRNISGVGYQIISNLK